MHRYRAPIAADLLANLPHKQRPAGAVTVIEVSELTVYEVAAVEAK